MKYLLDVNTLLAAILELHPSHAAANAWIRKRNVVLCPISQLGFLRISTHPKVYNLSMPLAQEALRDFEAKRKTGFVPANLSAANLSAPSSDAVTDIYLAELAAKNEMKLATFDAQIDHAAVELVSDL
jgi:predicted nucleic acid-binding protein